jgi:hypothetical protein
MQLPEKQGPRDRHKLSVFTARAESERFIRHMQETPAPDGGRGIVISAGGPKYLPCAWVCINRLKKAGCKLPIQLWHLGPEEMDPAFQAMVEELGVRCVDALEVRKRHPARILNGWELKCYSILHSGFREVLLLDADNVPIVDPEFLFDTPEFRQTGAIFWPDYGRLAETRPIWKLCGVSYRDEPEFETGQIVVDQERCQRALRLAMWYNEHSDFFYHHIHGDKDTFHLAFRKTNTPYSMTATQIERLPGTMCQHDFKGRRILQHRNGHKWTLRGENPHIAGFHYEEECLDALNVLRSKWGPCTLTADRSGEIATQQK